MSRTLFLHVWMGMIRPTTTTPSIATVETIARLFASSFAPSALSRGWAILSATTQVRSSALQTSHTFCKKNMLPLFLGLLMCEKYPLTNEFCTHCIINHHGAFSSISFSCACMTVSRSRFMQVAATAMASPLGRVATGVALAASAIPASIPNEYA